MGCSKIILVAVNVLFLIFGLAVLIMGIVFKVNWADLRDAFVEQSDDKTDFNLQYAGDMVGIAGIVFGAFMTLVSILGCIGGLCKVRFLLAVYAIIVMILLICQIGVVIAAAVKGSEAEDVLVDGLRDSLKNHQEDLSNDRSKAWAAVFSTLSCCGVVTGNATTDFAGMVKSTYRTAGETAKIPIGCCKSFDYESKQTEETYKEEKIVKCLTTSPPANTYTDGCETKVKDAITDNKGIFIGVGVAIFLIELMVMILAWYMCCNHDHKDYTA